MAETSATKPPQLRAARARKQRIIKFVILFVTLAFLFVPLLAMLIFTLRHPLSGRWSAAPWIAIFTGNGESLGADLTVLWQGIGTSLALSAVTVVIMLVLLHQKDLYIFPAYLCAAATRYMIDWLYMCLGTGGLLLAISGIVAFARKGKNCKG